MRHWIWFLAIFLLAPVATLAYGLFGPELPSHGTVTYIEGAPRNPVTTLRHARRRRSCLFLQRWLCYRKQARAPRDMGTAPRAEGGHR